MTQPTMQLRSKVFEALDNAVENGYIQLEDLDIAPLTAPEMAKDLVMFDAALEHCSPEELRPHVEAWIGVKRK